MSKKISQMPVVTSLADADLITAIDLSEPDATKNVGITKANLQAGLATTASVSSVAGDLATHAGMTGAAAHAGMLVTADMNSHKSGADQHSIAGVTNLQTELNQKANTADLGDASSLDVGTVAGTVAAGDRPAAVVTAHESIYLHGNLPTAAQKSAMTNAASPSGANPFATVADLSDEGIDLKSSGQASQQILVTDGADGFVYEAKPAGGATTTFKDLTDTPASYAGQAGLAVRVAATELGLEFYPAPGMVDVTAAFGVDAALSDNRTQLQAALDSTKDCYLPPGVYDVSGELVWSDGSKLTGAAAWSGTQRSQKTTGTSVIRYVGASGAGTCLARLSKAAVGTNPEVSLGVADATLMNAKCTRITFDANHLADYAVYCVRAWTNNELDHLTATGAIKHGFWAAKCWYATIRNWVAISNAGAGITLGRNDYGWDNAGVDQATLDGFCAEFNGTNAADEFIGAFDETTGQDKEYGLGLFANRALMMVNYQAHKNGGSGCYVQNSFPHVKFIGGYSEENAKSPNNASGKNWSIWVNSTTSTWNHTWDHHHLGLSPYIRLTGTPTVREEHAIKFQRMVHMVAIDADFGMYKLEDCNKDVIFSNARPTAHNVVSYGVSYGMQSEAKTSYDSASATWSLLVNGSTVFQSTSSSTRFWDPVTVTPRLLATRLSVGPPKTETIAGGVISVSTTSVSLITEGLAATDDLDTINSGSAGDLLILQLANSANNVVVKNGTGNIYCGSDILLDIYSDRLTLISNGTAWYLADKQGQSSGVVIGTTPKAKDDPGTPGDVSFSGVYMYYCYAANSWARTAMETNYAL